MADYYAVAGYRNLQRRAVQNGVNDSRFGRTPLNDLPLAMAYVPMQQLGTTYESVNALEKGTLFPDLELPFIGKGACK